MAEESGLPTSPTPDLSDRVDALLSSALADQAREKKQLVDTLYGARAALVKAEEEIEGLKDQISIRDSELLEAIDLKFAARIDAIEEAILQLAKSIAQIPAKVRKDIEVAAVAVGERIGEESDSLLTNFREDAVEVVATLSKLSDKSLATTQNAVEAAREEYRTTTEQVVKYLGERDDALQRQRDQVLVSLFKQLGESLGKRNSKKVSKGMTDPAVGRTPSPAPKAQKAASGGPAYQPAPYQPPAYQTVRPSQPGPSFVSPPERSQPIPLNPAPPPAAPSTEAIPATPAPIQLEDEMDYEVVPVAYDYQDAYEDDDILEETRLPPAPTPAPARPERDFLVRVPTYQSPEEEMQDRLAGVFDPPETDFDKPRRARRKPAPPAAAKPPRPRVVKAQKPPAPAPRRGPRRKPEA